MENLESMDDQEGGIKALQLPFASYALKKISYGKGYYTENIITDSWKSVFERYNNIWVSADENKLFDKKLNNFLDELWTGIDNTDPEKKISVFHDYVNENIEIVYLEEKETTFPLNYYLVKTKQVNRQVLFRIYQYAIEKAGLEPYFVMARYFHAGPIDRSFTAAQQITTFLLGYKPEAGPMKYITPTYSNQSYELNEIKESLQGTSCITVKLTKEKSIGFAKLPNNRQIDNLRSRQVKVTVKLEEPKVHQEFSETLTGSYSTNNRYTYMTAKKDDELGKIFTDILKKRVDNAILDSIKIESFSKEFPFTFKLKYSYRIDNTVTKIDDGLYSIALDDWFYHHTDKLKKENRLLDYYFDKNGTDVFKYFLVFDEKIQIVNGEKLNKIITGRYCKYDLSISQVNENTVLIESKLQTIASRVPAIKIGEIVDTYEAVDNADNEPLVIKKL